MISPGHIVALPAQAVDEMDQLAARFNSMASKLEKTERRRVEVVSDLAHVLSTPVATLTGYLDGLFDGVAHLSPATGAHLPTKPLPLRRLVDDLPKRALTRGGDAATAIGADTTRAPRLLAMQRRPLQRRASIGTSATPPAGLPHRSGELATHQAPRLPQTG